MTAGSGGSSLILRSDDLNSIGELYTEDDFRQLVVTIEATPAFFGGLGGVEIVHSYFEQPFQSPWQQALRADLRATLIPQIEINIDRHPGSLGPTSQGAQTPILAGYAGN